ncbi:MAG TPA: sigma 54-interacting transcriptional regulator [Pseudogracilibacillus sp.]|nr:sigma 54-interacting transcriptional regulator [Pseudogracilibacillus sp.]
MKVLNKHTVRNWCNEDVQTVHHLMTIQEALELFSQLEQTELPVIDEGRFMGVLRLQDCLCVLNEQGPLEDPIYHLMKESSQKLRENDLMSSISTLPVYVAEEVSERLLGVIYEAELIAYQRQLEKELNEQNELVKWFDLSFETAYEGLAVVDKDGIIRVFNEPYSRFVGVSKEDAIGKRADKVIENTRLLTVLKTGVPERSQAHRLQGQDLVVHRLPIWKDGDLIGAVGMLVYEGVSEIYEVIERMKELERDGFTFTKNIADDYKLNGKIRFEDILGESHAISETKKIARKASLTTASVIITGESGVGKEQFAKAIHDMGIKSDGNFVSVNCAAIPSDLLESELFGYADGAFTGARSSGKKGKFELAHGGTLFLDEIGDMPLEMQAKILRVLQERKVERVGSNTSIPVDFRLITATNKDLRELISEGLFREDLFYRLFVIPLEIPPLRERKQDIPIIVSATMSELSRKYDVQEKTIDQKILQKMYQHHWPGNVRELINVLERLFVLTDDPHIKATDVPDALLGFSTEQALELKEKQIQKAEVHHLVLEKEKAEIELALKETEGNKTEAARLLGISRATLYNKISRFSLDV